MSPEILKEEDYDAKTDVYSMGISMYELCFFQTPRKPGVSPNGSVVLAEITLTKNQNLYSPQLLSILQKMIEIDRSKRPSSSELCQMIRSQYIQTFLKTSSLSSVARCLYSLPFLTKSLMKIQKNNNQNSRPITQGLTNAFQQINNNVLFISLSSFTSFSVLHLSFFLFKVKFLKSIVLPLKFNFSSPNAFPA